MNKHFLLGLFLVAISSVSCSKREIELDEADPAMVKAITENLIEANATSKSEKEVLWNPGDEIAVFSGELSGKFESTLKKKPSSAAVFRGDLGLEAWPEEMDIWAVYPYSEEAFFDGETITTVLPSEQIARDGEFGKDMNLAIAHSNTSILQFYNVGGGIRFSVTEEGIKKVMFEGLGGEIISGKVKIGFDDDGLPEIRKVVSGSQFITILPPDGQETFQKDTWYYIVVIPGSLERGYKLRFYKDSDYARKVSNNSMKIKRSFYRDLEKVDYGIEYEAQAVHFPMTKKDWEKSIEISERVTPLVWSILNQYMDHPLEDFLEELLCIDEVIRVDSLTMGRGIAVMQKDSIWINYFLNTRLSIETERMIEENVRQASVKLASMPYHYYDQVKLMNAKKKAIILSPFQSYFKYNYNTIVDALVDVGFLRENVDVYEDLNASFRLFTGEYLCQYDFILIATHGGVGYKSYSTGKTVHNVSTLGTSLRYNKQVLDQLISIGAFNKDDFALVSLETDNGEETVCAMTPSFLGDAAFDNACVILDACSSSALSDRNDPGSMVWRFLKNGAAIVSGYSKDKTTDAFRLESLIMQLVSKGFSYQDASDYIMGSENTKTFCDNSFMRSYMRYPDEWSIADKFMFDIYNLFECFENPKHIGKPYYFIDPFPQLNDVSKATLGEVNLSWNSSLGTCDLDYSYRTVFNTRVSLVETVNVKYDVLIDSTLVDGGYGLSETSFIWDSPTVGMHSWSVCARMMQGEEIVAAFQSEEGHFTVTGESIKVNSISLNKTSLELPVGNTATLKETILPSNATNKNVTWSSSNPSVATVSSTGEVKGVAKGSSVITVRTEDGGKTATCRVTVTETKVPVSGVSLSKTSLSMVVGETQTLTATVTPSNATDKSVTWSSSNTSVATVSSSGVVSAKKAGTATITVKTNDGGKKATCSVTVKDTSMGGDIEGTGENQWN